MAKASTIIPAILALATLAAGPALSATAESDIETLLGKLYTPAIAAAEMIWKKCTENAVDRLADQTEPARTVAESAMAICVLEEGKLMLATGIKFPESIRDAGLADLVARTMVVRAARASRIAR